MSYATEVAADSPFAWYKLDETSGLTNADSSGNGYSGAWDGTPGWAVTGAMAGSTGVEFDADADILYWPAGAKAAMGGLTTFSMEFWVKRSATTKVITIGAQSSVGRRAMVVLDSDGKLYVQYENNGTSTASFPNTPGPGASAWHHVVVTFDGSQTGLARIAVYIDKVAQTVTAGGGNPPASLPIDADLGTVKASVTLGGSGTIQLDEVAFYSTALSSTRVTAHYDAATGGGGGGSVSGSRMGLLGVGN